MRTRSLKRRFLQNQQDCTFTVLALLPTLGARILEEMDVETVTETLQGRSRSVAVPGPSNALAPPSQGSRDPSVSSARSGRLSPPETHPHHSTHSTTHIQSHLPASLVNSAIHGDQDANSSGVSVNGEDAAHAQLGESSMSWVEQFTTSSASNGGGSPASSAGPLLSDTNLSGSVSNASDLEVVSEASFLVYTTDDASL
jgi:peroxin-3